VRAGERQCANFTCPFHSWNFANDGRLVGYAFPEGYQDLDRSRLGLGRVRRVESYKGFVFGSFAEDGPSLKEHLGGAAETIDRLAMTSPEGEVQITAGFLKHRVKANWKFVLGNETDGHHPAFVHSSIFGVADSALGQVFGDKSLAVTRDYGNGHTEIDLRPEFRRSDTPLRWFGTTIAQAGEFIRRHFTRRVATCYGTKRDRVVGFGVDSRRARRAQCRRAGRA
jgi:phenylpropionate dioxygenase-like ring-hydroxylating dioxygenase large terminal subunit